MNSLNSGQNAPAEPGSGDDELLFADEVGSADDPLAAGRIGADSGSHEPWTILIVDDDEEIHEVTKLALDDIRVAGRGLRFLSAFSGAEACQLAAEHDDIALILLDVVMETEHAGLDVVRYVREELGNRFARIVLRTGQPGQAPEKDVIVEYDINDYKSKTELTHQRMFTMVYTSLSSYRDLIALNANRAGLKSIIEASATLFDLHEAEHFAHGVLRQLTSLLYLGSPSRAERAAALVAVLDGDEPRAIAERGQLGDPRAAAGADASGEGGAGDDRALPAQVAERVIRAANERCSVSGRDYFAGYLPDCGPHATVLYVEGSDPFTVPDWQMVELFCRNAAIAQENISLKRESEDTQREIVYLLGEAIEKRSNETGNHVRRVGEYCRLLGRLSELPAEEAEILLLAAPLHDAGKIAIPDAILNKPGRHTPDEQAIMRTHARHGAELLSGYERPVLKAAAIIAAQHHEKWDGSGYPLGLRGTEIHIYGRIAALADVFDALGSDRCYKAAWPLERILNLVRDERGKHFDPALVDLFLGHIEQFLAIRDRYSDRYSEGGERST